MPKEDTFDVVGIGVSPLDILALVESFPTEDEVHQAIQIIAQGGGPVATALATLARLGARTAMVDAIGDDWQGKLILEEFHRANVSSKHIRVRPGFTSAITSILVHQGTGSRAIYHFPGNAPELSPDELPFEVILNCKFLHINGRHLEACKKAIKEAKKSGVKISFDGGAGRYRYELDPLIPEVNILIAAKAFAQACTGENLVFEMGKRLLKKGPQIVVITDGLQGSWIFEQDNLSFHQPAFLMPKVIDTTGCGDSYHGAFLFGLMNHYPLPETARFASAVAALNTQGLGGRTALPGYQDVITFLKSRDSQSIPV